jgi:rod shape-determining protein MreD
MSWPVVLVFGYLCVGLELVVASELRLGDTAVAPSFVVPFLVFIALFAPATRVYWTALILGLSLDLLTPWAAGTVVPGPKALGFLLAAYFIVTLRTLINRNTLAVIVFSIVAMAIAQVFFVAVMTFRSVYTVPAPAWHGRAELGQRLLASLYTGGSAAVLGLLLFTFQGLFRFQEPYSRRSRGGMRG